jgi:hypothetical protein
MLLVNDFLKDFDNYFPNLGESTPWHFIAHIREHISESGQKIKSAYRIHDDVIIHESATIEEGVIIKGH